MGIGDRLRTAMDHGGFDTDAKLVQAIHQTLGIKEGDRPFTSQQMISKIKRDQLKSRQSSLVPYIAHECNVSAIWLVADIGPMVPLRSGDRIEPDDVVFLNTLKTLPKDMRDTVHDLVEISAKYIKPGLTLVEKTSETISSNE